MNFKKILFYSANVEAQKDFYTKGLGFRLLGAEKDKFTVAIGETQLEFMYKENAPTYHFAFNIPSNKGAEALAWLKERVDILDFQGDELVDFTDWNAEAMYFYDVDKNIVEFIARKNLEMNSVCAFSSEEVLAVSEIGLPTDHVRTILKAIRQYFPIDIYSGDEVRFCAAGDEHGLFIIIDKAQKKWIPRNDEAEPAYFKVFLEHAGETFELEYKEGILS